jgi:hypothetical protein
MKALKSIARKVISVCVNPVVRTCLEAVAIEENRSLSSIIESLLMEHFEIPKSRPSHWTKAEQTASEMEFPQEVDIERNP